MFKLKYKNCFTILVGILALMLIILPATSYGVRGGGGGSRSGGGGHGGAMSFSHGGGWGEHGGAMSFNRGGSFGRMGSASFDRHGADGFAFRSDSGHRFHDNMSFNRNSFSPRRDFASFDHRHDFEHRRDFDHRRDFFHDRFIDSDFIFASRFGFPHHHVFFPIFPFHHHRFILINGFGFWPWWYDYGYGYSYPYQYGGDTNNYYSYNYYGTGNTPNYTQQQQPATPTADQYFDDGLKAFGNNDFKTAVAKFALASRIAPDDKVLPFAYSQAFLATGDYKSAAQVLRSAIAKIKSVEEGVFYPRGLYTSDDILLKQIADLNTAANQNRQDADLQLLIGYQYLGIGELAKASEPLRNISLDSINGPAARTLLEILNKLETEKAKISPAGTTAKAESGAKIETPTKVETPAQNK